MQYLATITAVIMMMRSKNAKRTAIIAGLDALYMCSIFSLSTMGGRRVSISSGGSVTGSMPQKSSLRGELTLHLHMETSYCNTINSYLERNRYMRCKLSVSKSYLMVSGVAWILLSGSS